MAAITKPTVPLLWTSSLPTPGDLIPDDHPSLHNTNSLIGRVQYEHSSSSFDWSSRSSRSSSPRASHSSARTPTTVPLPEQLTLSIHPDPPSVPHLNLHQASRRRTSSAPPVLTPKTSPSSSNPMNLSTESSSSQHSFTGSDSNPPGVEEKHEVSDAINPNE